MATPLNLVSPVAIEKRTSLLDDHMWVDVVRHTNLQVCGSTKRKRDINNLTSWRSWRQRQED